MYLNHVCVAGVTKHMWAKLKPCDITMTLLCLYKKLHSIVIFTKELGNTFYICSYAYILKSCIVGLKLIIRCVLCMINKMTQHHDYCMEHIVNVKQVDEHVTI